MEQVQEQVEALRRKRGAEKGQKGGNLLDDSEDGEEGGEGGATKKRRGQKRSKINQKPFGMNKK